MLQELSDKEALRAIKEADFSDELKNSAENVAVILTQNWCPQWIAMKGYLKKAVRENDNLHIYTLSYNKKDYFQQFMSMKENAWGNALVPYIRYYKNARLVGESNFIGYKGFLNQFDKN